MSLCRSEFSFNLKKKCQCVTQFCLFSVLLRMKDFFFPLSRKRMWVFVIGWLYQGHHGAIFSIQTKNHCYVSTHSLAASRRSRSGFFQKCVYLLFLNQRGSSPDCWNTLCAYNKSCGPMARRVLFWLQCYNEVCMYIVLYLVMFQE